MTDIEEPLPEWAAGRSDGDYMVPMTQLLTRDGRRCGNAAVLRIEISHGVEVAVVHTDAGNNMKLTRGEVEGYFHPPIFMLKTTMAHERINLLRQWKCENCGGSGTYLNRNRIKGTERVPCKFCEGTGIHVRALLAIEQIEGKI